MAAVGTPKMLDNKPWADQPYPLLRTDDWETRDVNKHSAIKIAIEMVLAHNCFIRAFNAIALQGPNIHRPSDAAAFLHFIRSAVTGVHHHHAVEEEVLFPHIADMTGDPQLMESNIGQHAGFHAGLDRLGAYARDTAPERYAWPELKIILDAFVPALTEHLSAEIPTLLALQRYDSATLLKGWERAEAKAKTALEGEAMREWAPLFFTLSDNSYEGGALGRFPPVPFFVPYLVKYVFGKRHEDAWRFGPCDYFGRPRPLPFA